MAIKLTYQDINNQNLAMALGKLATKTGFTMKTAYNISKIKEKVMKEVERGRELFNKLHSKYWPDPNNQTELPEDQKKAYDKDFEEFMSLTFEVPYYKLKLSELEKAELTPDEILALEPIVDTSEFEVIPTLVDQDKAAS